MFENIEARVVDSVATALSLDPVATNLTSETELLGSLPEFDSQSVVVILTALEDEFDIEIDDDEISADIFYDVAALIEFVRAKADIAD